jgi:pimeloyl-ACP methyl ester carboxylesterase
LTLPGTGSHPRSSASATKRAELAFELLHALGLAPAVWIGFSWGGNIGIHTAVRFPSSVCALCLLDSGYLQASDDPDYDPAGSFEREAAEVRRLTAEGQTFDAPAEVIAAAMVGSWEHPCPPLYDALRALCVPVLLAHATESGSLHEVREQALARFRQGLPSADVVRIAGARHGLLEDQPAEVCRLVTDWLARFGR